MKSYLHYFLFEATSLSLPQLQQNIQSMLVKELAEIFSDTTVS